MDVCQSLELISSIPMESNARCVLQGTCMRLQCFGPLQNMVLVVVENVDFHLRVLLLHRGAQLPCYEIQLLLRIVYAFLPHPILPIVLWLVLGCECPDRDPMVFVSFDPLGDVLGPSCLVFVLQAWLVRSLHFPIGLH